MHCTALCCPRVEFRVTNESKTVSSQKSQAFLQLNSSRITVSLIFLHLAEDAFLSIITDTWIPKGKRRRRTSEKFKHVREKSSFRVLTGE